MQPLNPNPRPGSVTTVAILAIIYGSIMVLLCGGCGLLQQFMTIGPKNASAEELKQMTAAATIGSSVGYLLLGSLSLAGGIGALSLKPAARGMLMAYSIISIVFCVGMLILYFAYTGPLTEKFISKIMAEERAKSGGAAPDMTGLIKGGQIVGIVITALFNVGLPIVYMALLSTERAKAAFAGGGQGGGGYPPQNQGGYYQQ